ncbi:hypothetical protein [Longimicrobium sp.]|jgi:hypothetical protein|uniref:hypothetical protein n=1 Tax=Longimicrobium sp. TaxID=2029185 RepID=UPI002ED7A286
MSDMPWEHDRRIRELSEIFRDLGADDYEDRARSEVEEDTPQLATFLALRKMWRHAMPWRDDPHGWIEVVVEEADDPNAPFPDAGQALRRMLAAGADPDDVLKVTRMVALETLFSTLHTVDDGRDHAAPEGTPGWRLVETDPEGEPTGRVVSGLHKEVLFLEPRRGGRR